MSSIVCQTYERLEILVVDDGSTDGCPAMCDAWAARDRRITVVHKSNGGLSDARNAALDVIKGSLVTMIDSDDSVEPEYISTLLKLMMQTDADVAVCGWREVYDDGSIGFTTPVSHKMQVYTGTQTLNAIFYQKRLTHSAWGRLYKSSLFTHLRYPVGMLYEDLAIAYSLYGKVTRVAQCFTPLYNYLQRPTSILGAFKPQRTHVLDILDALEAQVAAEGSPLLPAVQSRRLSAHFNILLLCPSTPQFEPVRRRCSTVIKQLRTRCLFDPHVRLKNRLGILASFMGMNTFYRLFSKARE